MRFAIAALAGFALAALPASALTVETKISTEFQEKLQDDYGVREADMLTRNLSESLQQEFARKGAKADKIVVTIHDAKPNRPTMQQISEKIGLDPIRSIGVGGAKISGVAYDASGREIGTLDYNWYETDITQVIAANTWHDAYWAFDRFARKFARNVG